MLRVARHELCCNFRWNSPRNWAVRPTTRFGIGWKSFVCTNPKFPWQSVEVEQDRPVKKRIGWKHTYYLQKLPKFTFHGLIDNKLNGSIPPKILHLPSLSTFLNLSNNYLTGSLPEEVGFLVTIDSLAGDMPKSIGNRKRLEHSLLGTIVQRCYQAKFRIL